MPTAGRNQLNVMIDWDVKQQFREKAKASGTTATALINQWINDYLSEPNQTSENTSLIYDENDLESNASEPNLSGNKNQNEPNLNSDHLFQMEQSVQELKKK